MRDLKSVEELLRNGKLPNRDLGPLRHKVWQKVLQQQRRRRKPAVALNLSP